MWLEYNTDTLPKTVTKKEDVRTEFGRFCYLEAHEYRMFNTCKKAIILRQVQTTCYTVNMLFSDDVHFYASFALSILW